jgi:bifunctional DNase/RNase
MKVMAIGLESGAARPVLLLQEVSRSRRLLPVWIGIAEANAITLEQHHVSLPRPMTRQLIGVVLDGVRPPSGTGGSPKCATTPSTPS